MEETLEQDFFQIAVGWRKNGEEGIVFVDCRSWRPNFSKYMKMSFKDECGRLCDKVLCTVHVHKSPNAQNKRQTFVNTKILHIVNTAVKPVI